MTFLYDWVKSLAIFMILISLIRNLLPKGHYEKYLRLFTGMLAVLLVLKPFTGFLGIEENIDDLFSLDMYSQEMAAMREDFVQAGSGFEDLLVSGYEEQMKKQIQLLLKEEGVEAAQIDFYVCMDESDKRYGSISRMEIYLGKEAVRRQDTGFPEIQTPKVGLDTEEEKETGFLSSYEQIEQEKLAEKICQYYNLERNQVKIYG